jgi:hypothetical protein
MFMNKIAGVIRRRGGIEPRAADVVDIAAVG